MMELVRYNEARRALAAANSRDEVKDIHDKAVAIQAYARQAKDEELISYATEIKKRAERRLGEVMNEQPKATGTRSQLVGPGVIGGTPTDPPIPTFKELGIDKHLADRARKAAAMPEKEFEAVVTATVNKAIAAVNEEKRNKFQELTGEVEWYTPPHILSAAAKAMGNIDLDPASSHWAQQYVKATNYFTRKEDGLKQKWFGRVWLNPPYSSPELDHFVDKMISSYLNSDISEGILLTNSATDTNWFHRAASVAVITCFTLGRIHFLQGKDGTMLPKNSPTHGQIFFYYGNRPKSFVDVFRHFGRLYPEVINTMSKEEMKNKTLIDLEELNL